jgi:hypothetical protein
MEGVKNCPPLTDSLFFLKVGFKKMKLAHDRACFATRGFAQPVLFDDQCLPIVTPVSFGEAADSLHDPLLMEHCAARHSRTTVPPFHIALFTEHCRPVPCSTFSGCSM